MVELIRGIKAGVVAGLIYGVVYAFFFVLFFWAFASLYDIPIMPPPFSGQYVTWRANPLLALIIGPIFGTILGIIFAFTYSRLPGKKLGEWTVFVAKGAWTVSMVKGAILAFIVWAILFVITILTGFPTGLYISELEHYRNHQIFLMAFASLLFVGILGFQLGYFWDKFERFPVQAADN
jgi:hypothetical protein